MQDAIHLLAHQGGWDEVLPFAVPALGVLGFVVWAERKARARTRAQEEKEPGGSATMPRRDDTPEKES